ncbi:MULTISPECIES: TonB-dependent receptor [Henriciella]|uniref:TonB-dependent receptor n=1 Tax=Henriciella marina TaxID=453851 RepID=A0ABT4LXG6_9PROT|nr:MULTISPECIES: TonB-dependent receptor [Henriciella]MCZ4298218.1 TonB-dependent receptor [Henriciella marina]
MPYLNRLSKVTASVSGAVLLLAAGAHAQAEVNEQNVAVSANSEPTIRRLGAVTVTAQKREQSLQDVPIVVTALSGELLNDAGVQDIKDLTVVTPGLLVTSSSKQANTTARIRGIGTVGDNPGLESSVGVVVDGVPRARNGVSFGDLGEIERIEVLKGPQGTLFGKSTSAGVINVVTKKPSNEFGSIWEVGIGNEGFLRTSGEVTGPLSDAVSGRLYGVYEERDGLLDVKTGNGPRTADETSQYDFYSFRGQLLFEPSSDLEILLSADYTDREEDCCMGDYIAVDPARGPLITLLAGGDGASAFPVDPYDRVAFANRDATQTTEDWGVSADISWQSDVGELTSITSYRDWDNGSGQDMDFSAADIWFRDSDETTDAFATFSQEIRLAGATDKLDWLVGAYYANETLDRTDFINFGNDYFFYFQQLLLGASGGAFNLAALPGSIYTGETKATEDIFKQEADTYAIFTNNTFSFTDQFDLTVGLRYTIDEKTLNSDFDGNEGSCSTALAVFGAANGLTPTLCLPWVNDNFVGVSSTQDRSDEDLSGTVKGSYRFSENLMSYASYSRGYKAGGFNLDRSQFGPADPAPFQPNLDTGFDPETVDAYEVGFKSNNAANSLFFNGAIFYQEYNDFQLNTFTGTSFIVTSVPAVISKGAEFDFRYLPEKLEGLTLQGGLVYAETQYDDFEAVDFFAPPRLPGSTISFAPRWSGTLAVTYETSFVRDWDTRFNVSSRYTSRYNTGSNLDPLKEVDDLVVVNARMGFYSDNSPFELEIWAQNLFDEDYYELAFDTPLQGTAATQTSPGTAVGAFLAPPLTFGATARLRF